MRAFGIIAVLLAFACTPADEAADAGAGSDAAGGSAGPGACPAVATGAPEACRACGGDQCCAAARACDADPDCSACVAQAPAQRSTECNQTALFLDVQECLNGSCSEACNPQGSAAADCRAIVCTEGESGDETCRAQGCAGGCFYGGCVAF